MEAFLSKVLDKISRYEIMTNLIPGALLLFLLDKIGFDVIADSTAVNIIACYFIGLINNRFSSLCIEEPLKALKLIQWREYELYNKAKKARPFVATLQETANQFRALAAVFLLALLAILYKWLQSVCPFMMDYGFIIIIALLLVLFVASYRKQVNDYVVKNIDEVEEEIIIEQQNN